MRLVVVDITKLYDIVRYYLKLINLVASLTIENDDPLYLAQFLINPVKGW